MDNIDSHINVKFYLVFWKNISKNFKKLGKFSYFFILELILTTLLNTCIILIVILM